MNEVHWAALAGYPLLATLQLLPLLGALFLLILRKARLAVAIGRLFAVAELVVALELYARIEVSDSEDTGPGGRIAEWTSVAEEGTTFRTEHFRCIDSLGILLRNGSITPEMHDAGQDFNRVFVFAQMSPAGAPPLDRLPGAKWQDSITERVYTAGIGEAVPLDDGTVWAAAAENLAARPMPDRMQAWSLAPGTGSPDGMTAVVRVTGTAELPILSSAAEFIGRSITITVESRARADVNAAAVPRQAP
ncbi:MAG: hypothetical protein J5W83_16635 [Candidatus Accumulibacter sp.]|uniref:hypothetical protein n=1 Tax=Accumulibacter sp. TaxID=2053492 RepID=UPI001B0B3D4C|nr:hypothetical protein [Accumulibacter sp.]MBO3704135.1 hypothetical protein [Accumulibacter sp.]